MAKLSRFSHDCEPMWETVMDGWMEQIVCQCTVCGSNSSAKFENCPICHSKMTNGTVKNPA